MSLRNFRPWWIAAALAGLVLLTRGGQALMYSAQVVRMAKAISVAEGTYDSVGNPVTSSLGYQRNNPLDLEDSDGNIISFPTLQDGWSRGYHQVNLMLTGESAVYSPNMSIIQVAGLYTGNDNPAGWAATVAQHLGLSITSTLTDVAGLMA